MLIAALAVGSLLVWSPALRAGDTNTPPSTPPAAAPPAGQPGPSMRSRPNFDQIAKTLELKDDQKPQVKAVLDERDQKIKDLRADTSLSLEDRRAKMKAIHDDVTAKMKEILTADQFAKWQKMPQTVMRERRNGPPPGNENAGSTNAPAAPPKQ
jgi:hypothetical protein